MIRNPLVIRGRRGCTVVAAPPGLKTVCLPIVLQTLSGRYASGPAVGTNAAEDDLRLVDRAVIVVVPLQNRAAH